MTHEVMVLCNCDDIERCRTEIYVSDVRIALAQIAWLWRQLLYQLRNGAV